MLPSPRSGGPGRPSSACRSSLLSLLFTAAVLGAATPPAEARVSLDLKDAAAVQVVTALAEVGRLQVVFDPGTSCSLTLRLRLVSWRTALESVLAACRLAGEEQGRVLRVASADRLEAEAQDRRRLLGEQARSRPRSVSVFRLSHARAAELAPVVKRLLAPRGDVVFDARTNAIIIVD
jgi:type IV pilus assembly protein PilQ